MIGTEINIHIIDRVRRDDFCQIIITDQALTALIPFIAIFLSSKYR